MRFVAGLSGSLPPSSLLVIGMLTVQLGAALAIGLFRSLGPAGVVFLRVGFASLIVASDLASVAASWCARGRAAGDYAAVVLFGLTLALMNFTFYSALARIPLGIAVTVEFIGPLSVAVAGSRRALDVLWAVLALGGILCWRRSGCSGSVPLDPLGLLLALVAGACWAIYILLTAQVGRAFPGGAGPSLAMIVGAVALLPVGIASAGSALLDPRLLLLGAAVALLSSSSPTLWRWPRFAGYPPAPSASS